MQVKYVYLINKGNRAEVVGKLAKTYLFRSRLSLRVKIWIQIQLSARENIMWRLSFLSSHWHRD